MGFAGSEPNITLVTWFDNMPAGCINGLVIKTGDVDKKIEELIAKGVAVGNTEQTPREKFAAVVDPDGDRLSFHEER